MGHSPDEILFATENNELNVCDSPWHKKKNLKVKIRSDSLAFEQLIRFESSETSLEFVTLFKLEMSS